jgi:hypothetical protein
MNKNIVKRKLLAIAGAFITLAIPFLMLGNNHIEQDQSLCPFKMLTGFPCPGCGVTKSIIFFYKGDLTKSFGYHLFGPFVVLFCVAAIIVLSVELITQKQYFRYFIYNKSIAYFLGFTLFSYHFVRLVYFVSHNNIASILAQSIWR